MRRSARHVQAAQRLSAACVYLDTQGALARIPLAWRETFSFAIFAAKIEDFATQGLRAALEFETLPRHEMPEVRSRGDVPYHRPD